VNNSNASFKAILIALFLLLTQSAVLAHAIDHDSTEHKGWCQLLTKADLSFAVSDSPQLIERFSLPEAFVVFHVASIVATDFSPYLSRAPPAV
jgi:hypothetical protein